jgi:hypothetical protein
VVVDNIENSCHMFSPSKALRRPGQYFHHAGIRADQGTGVIQQGYLAEAGRIGAEIRQA